VALLKQRRPREPRMRRKNPKRKNKRRRKKTRMRTMPSLDFLKKSIRSMKSISLERSVPRCTMRSRTFWSSSTTWKFRESVLRNRKSAYLPS
jgi:hypothetical protein